MQQIKFGILFLFLLVLLGTAGYVVVEDWSILEALYMTIITISTTGFAEVRPLTPLGRLLTSGLIVLGVAGIAHLGGRIAQLLIVSQLFRRLRVSKKVEELSKHYIICGYGRLGKTIAEDLTALKVPFVIIEHNEVKIERLLETSYLFIDGDATNDETLLQAGIERGKGIITVLETDADNVFVTLSAKVLNPKIFVVTRAVSDETEKKLLRAGANRVVKPYETDASRMVNLLLRPGVIDFMDIVVRKKDVDLNLEEIVVCPGSPLIDHTLAESPIRQDLNVIIVAIFRKNDEFIYNPTSSMKLQDGDRLIAIGQSAGLAQLNKLCG